MNNNILFENFTIKIKIIIKIFMIFNKKKKKYLIKFRNLYLYILIKFVEVIINYNILLFKIHKKIYFLNF